MALRDYLAARRDEIEGQMKALKAELGEIRIAEAALSGEPTRRNAVTGAQGPSPVREGSIKDWVLKALQVIEGGTETEDIIAGVLGIGGPLVPRNSMTPQLSRLKAMGLLVQEGRNWKLASGTAQNDETPGVSPPDVPEVEEEDLLG
jgi:hypothetical protein